MARNWLRSGDIIFSGHTLLYWVPLLKALRALKRHVVSLTYAREQLDFARLHSGIVALTPAAVDHARKIAPSVKSAYVGWGIDLDLLPPACVSTGVVPLLRHCQPGFYNFVSSRSTNKSVNPGYLPWIETRLGVESQRGRDRRRAGMAYGL